MQISIMGEAKYVYFCQNLPLIHGNCLKSDKLKHGVTRDYRGASQFADVGRNFLLSQLSRECNCDTC